jgi:Matrixin
MRRFLLLALPVLVLLSFVGGPATIVVQAATPHQTVSVTGYTQSATYGTRFDITLDVPPGADSAAIARDALARRGARPATAAGASPQTALPTLRWPQFFDHNHNAVVPQYYNPAGDPTPGGAGQALQSTEQEWTNVHPATFALQYAGITTRGAAFDGVNTVSWSPDAIFGDADILALTTDTYQLDTGFILDADVQVSSQFQWFANPADLTPTRFDVRYVLLHENGHVAGLGHSANPAAVMFPGGIPGIVGHRLTSIDIDALTRLYLPGQGTPEPPRQLRDFSATYTGSIAFTSSSTAAFTASGTGTYIGQSQVQGNVGVLPGTVSCPGTSFNTLHVDIITASNGDLLNLVGIDVSCETPPGSQVYHSVGTFTISYGTGRFEDVLGQGTIDAHADFTTHAFSITYAGTVASP